jgi:hypothetical protein
MLQTLMMGIKELTDKVSPAWQVAQNTGFHKQSSYSETILQDVSIKSNSAAPLHGCSLQSKPSIEPSIYLENTSGPSLKPVFNKNGSHPSAPKEMVQRPKDIDGLSELRKLLWRHIVPYNCLGATSDSRQNGEKTIRLLQSI